MIYLKMPLLIWEAIIKLNGFFYFSFSGLCKGIKAVQQHRCDKVYILLYCKNEVGVWILRQNKYIKNYCIYSVVITPTTVNNNQGCYGVAINRRIHAQHNVLS